MAAGAGTCEEKVAHAKATGAGTCKKSSAGICEEKVAQKRFDALLDESYRRGWDDGTENRSYETAYRAFE